MPGVEAEVGGRPCADEIRAALERMAASEAFRGSPQLVAFLRYVVEATLRGAADRIKGYTIAVEALGRADDFDPQADPIVRVEAMRLRRALARYYDNGGKHDPVVIDLPLGNYVPMFRRVAPLAETSPAAPAEPVPRLARRTGARAGATPTGGASRRALRWWRSAEASMAGSISGSTSTRPTRTARSQASSSRAGEPARPATVLSGHLCRRVPAGRRRRRRAGRPAARQGARRARALRRDRGHQRRAAGRRAPARARRTRRRAATP